MFRIFFLYICTEKPMRGVQSYYFGDAPVPIEYYYFRNEYSLSEFDIESDDLGCHLDTCIDVLYTPAMVLHNYP